MNIQLGSQAFDLAFHPAKAVAYCSLLNGQVKTIRYDHSAHHDIAHTLTLSQKSIRAISLTDDGTQLTAAGKAKAIYIVDTATNSLTEKRKKAHEASINTVKRLTQRLFATGDDDGTIKLWDSRTPKCVRTYQHHLDYITDFLWMGDSNHLLASSGDGTLSVMDIRSKHTKPLAQSEDQEDELLSLVSVNGNSKILVGTQLGIIAVFNPKRGWGDCVDRLPGHEESIDTMCPIPESFPHDTSRTVLTGSSDGIVRAVRVFPTKLKDLVTHESDWPVEHVAVGDGTASLGLSDGSVNDEQGRWWLGSISDEILKLTALRPLFSDIGDEFGVSGSDSEEDGDESEDDLQSEQQQPAAKRRREESEKGSDESDIKSKIKRQKKAEDVVNPQFFDDL